MAETFARGAEVREGQEVLFVPPVDFALDHAPGGGRAWVFAFADGKEVPDADLATLARERPQPRDALDGRQGELVVRGNVRVRPLRPRSFWPGVVTGAGDDGTYALDVKDGNGCATHHLTAKFDAKKTPGTFHLKGE